MTRRCADPALSLSSEDGFSLIEVLVTLAVIAGALLPLYALQQRAVEQAARLEEAALFDSWWRDSAPEVFSINPMVRCEGESDYGAFQLSWSCTALTPVSRNAAPQSAAGAIQAMAQGASAEEAMRPIAGPFEVALYEVAFTVSSTDQTDVTNDRAVTLLGWRRVAPISR